MSDRNWILADSVSPTTQIRYQPRTPPASATFMFLYQVLGLPPVACRLQNGCRTVAKGVQSGCTPDAGRSIGCKQVANRVQSGRTGVVFGFVACHPFHMGGRRQWTRDAVPPPAAPRRPTAHRAQSSERPSGPSASAEGCADPDATLGISPRSLDARVASGGRGAPTGVADRPIPPARGGGFPAPRRKRAISAL
jgi:hypothetical protein